MQLDYVATSPIRPHDDEDGADDDDDHDHDDDEDHAVIPKTAQVSLTTYATRLRRHISNTTS